MASEFENYWTRSFPGCPPVSYLFKWRMADRWLRVHSLPKAKRYPDDDEERSEVLRRQTILLGGIIGSSDECFFVGSASGDPPTIIYGESVPALSEILTTSARAIPAREVEEDDDDADGTWNVEIGKGRPDIDRLTRILLAIAEDQLSHFFVVNPTLNRIFAPYDGGVDLILEDPKHRDMFKSIYSEWLSLRADGL